MAKPATRAEWRPEEGLVILHAEEAGVPPTAVALSIPTVRTLAAYARRYSLPAGDRSTAWTDTEPVLVESFQVTVMPASAGERVVLTVDRGRDTEMGFSLSAEEAQTLGRLLSAAAGRVNRDRPPRN